MSTLSRIKIWISGDLLTAGDLNSEFNNIINDYNGSINMSNISAAISPTWTGTHTFGTFKLTGAGAGIATLTNANTATNRTITLPDPGADSTLVALAGAQTITGAKTFSPAALKVAGAGAGKISFAAENDANSATITFDTNAGVDYVLGPASVPVTDHGALTGLADDDHPQYALLASDETITGNWTFSGADAIILPSAVPTVARGVGSSGGILLVHDGTASRTYVPAETTQTISGTKTFQSFKLTGAGAGVATVVNANTASNRTLTLPDATDTVCGIAATQTLTNKTLTTPTIADLTNMTHLHTSNAEGGVLSTSAVTSGTFADARISSTSVTQHEAALTIAETQITDGTVLARVGGTETITGNWTFSGDVLFPTDDPPVANAAARESLCRGYLLSSNAPSSLEAFNVTSVAKNATGDFTVTWNRDFTNANDMVPLACAEEDTTAIFAMVDITGVSATDVLLFNASGTATDPNNFTICIFGNQA